MDGFKPYKGSIYQTTKYIKYVKTKISMTKIDLYISKIPNRWIHPVEAKPGLEITTNKMENLEILNSKIANIKY